MEPLLEFRDRWLVPKPGTIRRSAAPFQSSDPAVTAYSIEIPLKPFRVPSLDDAEKLVGVQTSIRLDGVSMPSGSLAQMERRTFHYPVNPAPGYIDGSIYIDHAHVPVDVTRIHIRSASARQITAMLSLRFCFHHEQVRFKDRRAELRAMLRVMRPQR